MSGKPPSASKDADLAGGVRYWDTQPASLDGVLGGYGKLTDLDSLTSRMFLLTVCPWLSTIKGPPAASSSLREDDDEHDEKPSGVNASERGTSSGNKRRSRRSKALDVGSGIGRVTASVLMPLCDSVDLVEPSRHFIQEAHRAATAGEWRSLARPSSSASNSHKTARFYANSLQGFDPCKKRNQGLIGSLDQARIVDAHAPSKQRQEGAADGTDVDAHQTVQAEGEDTPGYDVIWCQWCLGHCRLPFHLRVRVRTMYLLWTVHFTKKTIFSFRLQYPMINWSNGSKSAKLLCDHRRKASSSSRRTRRAKGRENTIQTTSLGQGESLAFLPLVWQNVHGSVRQGHADIDSAASMRTRISCECQIEQALQGAFRKGRVARGPRREAERLSDGTFPSHDVSAASASFV